MSATDLTTNIPCSTYSTVPESCYPFTSAGGYDEQDDDTVNGVLASDVGCLLPRFTSSASAIRQTVQSLGGCTAIVKRKKLFRTQPAYKVGRRNSPERPRLRETDIMFEIMTRGPVQGEEMTIHDAHDKVHDIFLVALMEVHSDFFLYESGIYHKTNLADPQESGFHSVKIIGWGEEEGIPYWVMLLRAKQIFRKYLQTFDSALHEFVGLLVGRIWPISHPTRLQRVSY